MILHNMYLTVRQNVYKSVLQERFVKVLNTALHMQRKAISWNTLISIRNCYLRKYILSMLITRLAAGW